MLLSSRKYVEGTLPILLTCITLITPIALVTLITLITLVALIALLITTRPDTDGDGLGDGLEVAILPTSPDTNTDLFVPDDDRTTTTNPLEADSDKVGILVVTRLFLAWINTSLYLTLGWNVGWLRRRQR